MTERFAIEPASTTMPWVDSPFFSKLLAKTPLDAEMADIVRQFATTGYAIIDPKIPSSVLDAAVKDLSGRFTPTYEPYYADERRLQDGWQFSSNIKSIATSERVMEVLRTLYRRDPVPFQTLNFRVGSEQRTHSDTIHFHSVPNLFMCGVWVALEDIDHTNGPLHYYPTSHKLPIYSMADLGVMAASPTALYDNYWMYEDFVQELMLSAELERVEMKMERGQALIWAANLFHGGSPIRNHDRTRLSQVTHYFFSDCLYYTPLLSDPGIGRVSLRKIYNLATDQIAAHAYNGKIITNPEEWPLQLDGCELSPVPGRIPQPSTEVMPPATIVDPKQASLPIKSRIKRLIEKTLS